VTRQALDRLRSQVARHAGTDSLAEHSGALRLRQLELAQVWLEGLRRKEGGAPPSRTTKMRAARRAPRTSNA
jgi:hypothetical protein